VIEVDPSGKIRLSRKAALREQGDGPLREKLREPSRAKQP